MSALSSNRKFKILLVGPLLSGKSTYVNRLKTGDFIDDYSATFGCVSTIIKSLKFGGKLVDIEFIDVSGQLPPSKLSEYKADGIIIMYDVLDFFCLREVSFWLGKCPKDIPFVVVGNKCDSSNPVYWKKVEKKYQKNHMLLSVKSCYNHKKPLSYFFECPDENAQVQ